MKKVLLSVITAALVCGLCGCNSSSGSSSGSTSDTSTSSASQTTLSAKEKTAKLLAEVEFPSMVEIDAQKLEFWFGTTEDEVTEYSVYICASGAKPDEFGILVAKDAETAGKIKEAIDKRIETQRNTFTDYTPKEMYKFDDCFVDVNGNTVCYAICADNEKAAVILN